jgi:ribonuclease Z
MDRLKSMGITPHPLKRSAMKPLFHPSLVNSPFGDPGLYIDFLFEKRAILFDIGEICHVPPRKLLRLSHVFVTHTHVDHFIGFDHLVRLFLGREKKLHIFGPPGFVDQIWHRLASYTWNLVHNYPTDFTIVATEIHLDGKTLTAEFHCRNGFQSPCNASFVVAGDIIAEEDTFRIRFTFLDHRIPVLAFSLEETSHVNIMKNRLEELGLQVGPWLTELKCAVLGGDDDESTFRVWWKNRAQIVERHIPLGQLKKDILHIVPGQKITYITDSAYTPGNAARMTELARGSDYLFIEAAFLHEDAGRAKEKYHLTARQAGLVGKESGAARVLPFHFSPKYIGREGRIYREVEQAAAE